VEEIRGTKELNKMNLTLCRTLSNELLSAERSVGVPPDIYQQEKDETQEPQNQTVVGLTIVVVVCRPKNCFVMLRLFLRLYIRLITVGGCGI
jgi:hypothetical protein